MPPPAGRASECHRQSRRVRSEGRDPPSAARSGRRFPPARRSLLAAPQPVSSVQGGSNDSLIAGAAAEIARDRVSRLLFSRGRVVLQKFKESDQNTRRAKAALQPVM